MLKRKQTFIDAIKSHIPPVRANTVTVCTRVDKELHAKFKAKLEADGFSVQAFTEASIKAYVASDPKRAA